MNKFSLILILFICFSNCKSSKKTTKSKASPTVIISNKNSLTTTHNIVDYAMTFKGVKYKSGGTTKAGMDCSGLVFETFRAHDIALPRSSRDMATKGTKINLSEAAKGDLLFFKTGRTSVINHVGLVVDVKKDEILFIHSTNSLGVIVSNIKERYWQNSFVRALRIL